MADGVFLSAPLAARRRLGAGPPHPRHGRPRAQRQGRVAVGGDPRQPVSAHRRSKEGAKGYDAAKKITGRKRHILTDTDGRLLCVRVHAADIPGP
ncbi:transposase [Xanthobacter cornucopiae]|uniref:transposase n=1 Tax=Xanthobacter cornucopiae TaxID=3119924 RepID=UPI00372D1D37